MDETSAPTQTVDVTTPEAAAHLARTVRARMVELDIRQRDLPALGGPGPSTIRSLFAAERAGEGWKAIHPGTEAKLDRAMRWERGSTRAVLAGGDPVPIETGHATIEAGDRDLGRVVITVPAEILDGLSETEMVEGQARLTAEFLAWARQVRGR